MKKFLQFLAVIGLFLPVTLIAQTEWIEFTSPRPQGPIITMDSMTSNGLYFKVEIPGMYRELKQINGESFYRLSLVNGMKFGKPGSPEIPGIARLTNLPECDQIQVLIIRSDSIVYDNYNICPVPELVPDSSNGYHELIEVFTKDQTAYSKNKFLPGIIGNINYPGYVRNQKVGQSEIHPLQYNPYAQVLKVYPHFQVQVLFMNPHLPVKKNIGFSNDFSKENQVIDNGTPDSVRNPRIPKTAGSVTWFDLTSTTQASSIIADYLIIADRQFVTPSHNLDLQRLAEHRANFDGYDVTIVDVQNILALAFEYDNYDFQAEQKIRSFIKLVYDGTDGTGNANHSYDGHLIDLLLVGDAFEPGNFNGVPASRDPNPGNGGDPAVNSINANDYYYSCITKFNDVWDPFGDLYIGRFPSDNEIELYNIVEKTIASDTQTSSDEWKHKNYYIEGVNQYPYEDFFLNDFYPYVDDLYALPYRSYLWNSTCNSTTIDDYTSFINNPGCNVVYYYGHGKSNQWDCAGTTSDFESHLQNWSKYPNVFAFSCETGTYANSPAGEDGIGEELVSFNPSAGFVSYIGANTFVFFTYDDDPSLNDFLPANEYTEIFKKQSHLLGESLLESKLSMPILPTLFNYPFVFNLFGDPALNMFPQGFEVTKDIVLTSNPYENEPGRIEPIIISTTIYVRYGSTLTITSGPFGGGSDVYFEKGGRIVVDPGSTLVIGPKVTFHGKDPENNIYVEGTLRGYPFPDQNDPKLYDVHFTSLTGTSWNGIELYNPNLGIHFDNCSFENCGINGTAGFINIEESSFLNSTLSINQTDFSMTECSLDHSNIDLHDFSNGIHTASIDQCINTSEPLASPVIKIQGYDFNLHNLELTGFGGEKGIELIDCGLDKGDASSRIHEIVGCEIHNESSSLTSYGIWIHHSNAYLTDNYIYHNKYGIICEYLDQDNDVIIQGNPDAQNNGETQRILDNYENQIKVHNSVFPCIHFNVIQSSVSNNPLFYYHFIPDPKFPSLDPFDIRCNCLPSNPVLFPSNAYIYNPTWCPPGYCAYGCTVKDLDDKGNSAGEPGIPDGGNNDSFILEQNIPNPFSGFTELTFKVPLSSEVKIFLSDLSGRMIRILEQRTFEKGCYHLNVDLSDLENGVYLVTLVTNSGIYKTIKITKNS